MINPFILTFFIFTGTLQEPVLVGSYEKYFVDKEVCKGNLEYIAKDLMTIELTDVPYFIVGECKEVPNNYKTI